MYDRFTDRAKKVMNLARQEAQRLNHEYLGTEHMLLGLVLEGSGVGASVLRNMNIDLAKIRTEVEKLVKTVPSMVTMGQLPFTPRAKKTLELAMGEATALKHNYIGTEHLLLGLIKEHDGIAAKVLTNLGVKLEDVREEVLEFLGAEHGEEEEEDTGSFSAQPKKTPALDAFGRDLTELARTGKLEPMVGRDGILEKLVQTLLRRTQNSPLLVGPPGTGKSVIIGGLAARILDDGVPEPLRGRRILAIDAQLMLAGTKYRGQHEERIRAVMTEARRSEDIMFLDDLRSVVGSEAEIGPVDLLGILRPALTRNEIRCIATCTLETHRLLVERRPEVARCFHVVEVPPTTAQETLEVLRVVRNRYEGHHRVAFSDDALRAVVELAELCFPQRHAPGCAVDLLDETGSRVSLSRYQPHPSHDLKEISVQIEALDLQKETAVHDQEWTLAAELRQRAHLLREERKELARTSLEKDAEDVEVSEDQIVDTAVEMTGMSREELEGRRRGGAVIRVDAQGVVPDVPAFERLQTESVLHGHGIHIERGTGFVLMPLRPEFRAIYEDAIQPAMEANGIRVMRAEDIFQPGQILAQVWQKIRSAEVILADVSGKNANVIMELGLCYALKRCPILLVRDPSELPFNLRNLRYIEYEDRAGEATKLREKLTTTIQQFLAAVRAPVPEVSDLASGHRRSLAGGAKTIVATLDPPLPFPTGPELDR